MKFMKKLLCLAMIFCMLGTPITTSADTEKAKYDYSKEIDFLTKIGISNVNHSVVDTPLTRAEAARYLSEASHAEGQPEEAFQVFLDVDAGHPAFEAVWYLKINGVLSDSADKMFHPDERITCNELVKMVVTLLGYEQYAQMKGGYPNGYYAAAARESKILKKINDDNIITKGELFSVIYQMLFTHILDINSLAYDAEGKTEISFQKGEAFLEKAFHLTSHQGQVRAAGFGSIYGKSTSGKNVVKIDDTIYRIRSEISPADLGKYVDFYLTQDDVIFAIAERDHTVYTIANKDISSETTVHRVVYEEENKTKTLEIAPDAYYVYNAQPLLGPTNADMLPSYGRLELLDNNNDDVIDVVKIWDYRSYYISSTAGNKLFVAENSDAVTYIQYKDTEKRVCIFDKNMSPVSESLLTAGKVITVAETADDMMIFLSDDIFEGNLEDMASDGTAVINGLEYEYLSSCKLEDAFGKSYKFYIDINETLVFANADNQSIYAVLFGIDKSKGLGGTVRVKLYDKGYFDIYECQDKVRISMDGGATFKRVDSTELYDKLYDVGISGIPKQLIKYETRDNKLSTIIVANTTDTAVNENEFRRNLAPGDDIQWNIGTRQVMYNADNSKLNYMWSNTDTYMYLVSDRESKCTFASMGDLYGGHYATYKGSSQKYANVSGYDLTETGYFKYLLVEMKDSDAVAEAPTLSSPLALITGRKVIQDTDGTVCNVLTAYTNDSHSRAVPTISNLIPSEDDLKNIARGSHTRYAAGTIKFSDLQKGDVIQYVQNKFTGRITSFTVLSRRNEFQTDVCTNDGFGGDAWDAVISGVVTVKDDFCIKIASDAVSHPVYGNAIPIMMDTTIATTENFDKIYCYHSESGKFELVTPRDIYEGARVWCYVEDKYFQYGVILVIVE